MGKLEDSLDLIKKSEPLALQYNDFGYHVAFSGGKDSQAILELCKMANVKYKAFFYKTSIDPPELLAFIRNNYPEVIVLYPKRTMYQLILKEKMLPTRQARFCCKYLKERQGVNAVVITGITSGESAKRKKRKSIEMSCIKGQDKVFVHPIMNWTRNDVLTFLKNNNIKICDLYSRQIRIGCIGCPMDLRRMRKDFNFYYPNFKLAYINTIKKLIYMGKYSEFENAEDVINWWMSGLSKKKYLMNKTQFKLFYNFKRR